MTIRTRLLRKPLTTLLWLLLTALMSAFLLVGFSLWYSTSRLAKTLDENTIAVAVRSDQAVIKKARSTLAAERYFTQKDKSFLEGLDSVKAVRSHTLSAAVLPTLTPILNIDRYQTYKAEGDPLPYCNAVMAGTYKGGSTFVDPATVMIRLTFEVKDILLVGEEYERSQAADRLREIGTVTVMIPKPRTYMEDGIVEWLDSNGFGRVEWFEKDRTYVLAGYYDPGAHVFDYSGIEDLLPRNGQVMYMGNLHVKDDMLWSYGFRYVPLGSSISSTAYSIEPAEDYALPAAELWEGDPQSFFEETPHDAWRTYRDAWEKQQHSLPVIGTEHLEAMYAFMSDRARIYEGRSFTEEEYESGAKVLIISRMLAEQCGVRVGDRLSLTQYRSFTGDYGDLGEVDEKSVGMRPGEYYNDPSADVLNLNQDYSAPEEEFTVVGMYDLLSAWVYGPYDFGPNTVFMPKKAQIEGAIGEILAEKVAPDIYGVLLSVELVNGRMDEFMTEIEGTEYEWQFFAYDQGVEGALKNIRDMTSSMERLFLMSAFGWLLFLVLYLLMFQGAERQTLGTMRSLGEPAGRAGSYLFGGGFLVALAGVIIGSAAGGAALRVIQQGILRDAVAGLDQTLDAEALAAAEEKLTAMHAASNLTAMQLILLAAGQLLLLTIALLIHTVILSHRHPRQLMEG